MQVNYLSRCIILFKKKIKSTKFYSNFLHPYLLKLCCYILFGIYIYVKNKFENQKQKSTSTKKKNYKLMTLTMGEKFNFAKMQTMKRFDMKIMNSI